MLTPRAQPALLLILGMALALRLATVTWGAGLRPYEGFYHPDEPKVWSVTAAFPEQYLTNRIYAYGTLVQNVLGALLSPVKALWRAGVRPPGFPGYGHFVLVAQRVLHALLGTLTIWLAYRLGLRLFDRRTALLGAAVLAASFLHATVSALATLDVPAAFFAALVLLLGARSVESGRLRDWAWLGAAAGAMLATKVSGAVVLIVPAGLLLWSLARRDPGEAPPRRALLLGFALAGLIAAGVFALSTPQVVLHPQDYARYMAEQRRLWIDRSLHDPASILAARSVAMTTALTLPVAVLSVAGLCLGWAGAAPHARRFHWTLLGALLADVLVWRGFVPPRYVLLFAPVLCLYAARPAALLMSRPSRPMRLLGVALACVAVGAGAWESLRGVRQRRQADPRTLAARYIAEHVPRGATLALAATTARDPWKRHPWRYPVLPAGAFADTPLLARAEYVVTTSFATEKIEQALASGQLGPDYVWPARLGGWWYQYLAPTPDEFRFYERLLRGDGGYEVERAWGPASRVALEFPAPEIRLYRRTTWRCSTRPRRCCC
jgi:hypothetical protein